MTEPRTTWAGVKDEPGLQTLTLSLHAFGEVMSKEWVRAGMPDWHWKRIVEIAETPAERRTDPAILGYSWVTEVVLDGRRVQLDPPEHLVECDPHLKRRSAS